MPWRDRERTAAPRVRGESLSSGGGGSIGVRLEYLGGRAPGASSDQTQHYTLTYTWADGTTESRAFTLYAYTPRPEWDDEGLCIRYPGDTEWTELDTLIPVPAEWAGQDLAGRDEAESLEGLLSGTGGMSDGLNGWFVFAIGHGVGARIPTSTAPATGAHLAGDWAARPGG